MANGGHHHLPSSDGNARGVLRAAELLQRQAFAWASRVVLLLPRQLPLTDVETELLKLFLAQQRRLNLELDGRSGSVPRVATRWALWRRDGHGPTTSAAHKLAACYIEQAIEDAADRFCGQHGVYPASATALDWRVALRYMAQQLHRIASRINFKQHHFLVPRLQMNLGATALPLAAEVAFKRARLLDGRGTAVSP